MRVRRLVWLVSCLLGFVIAGCSGGSGSSGFDNFPSSENAAIQTALDEQQCVVFEALRICPADTAAAVATATATPTPRQTATPGVTATPTNSTISPTPARTQHPGVTASPTPTPSPLPQPPQTPRVDTGVNQGAVPCAPVDTTSTCVFVVPFAPDGFPLSTVFRVAVRTAEPPGAWTIGPDLTATGSPNAPAFDAPVAVDAVPKQSDGPVRVQLAILAWVTPPTSIPATVDTLATSGADYAFVTSDLDVQPAFPTQ